MPGVSNKAVTHTVTITPVDPAEPSAVIELATHNGRLDILGYTVRAGSSSGLGDRMILDRVLAGLRTAAIPDSVTIKELDLSVRAYNMLDRIGVITVRQLLTYTPEQLLTLRNFDARALRSVQDALAARGLQLASTEGRERVAHVRQDVTSNGAPESHHTLQHPE